MFETAFVFYSCRYVVEMLIWESRMIDEVLQGNVFSNKLVGASVNLHVFVGKNLL